MPRPCQHHPCGHRRVVRAPVAVDRQGRFLAADGERPFVQTSARLFVIRRCASSSSGRRRQPVALHVGRRCIQRAVEAAELARDLQLGQRDRGADRDVDAVAHQVDEAVADVEIDAQRRVPVAQAGEPRHEQVLRRSPSSPRCGPGRSASRCSRRTRLRVPRTCSSGAGSSRETSHPRRSARARASSGAADARGSVPRCAYSARETWLTGTSRSRAAADSEPSAAMRENSFRSSKASPSIAAMVGGPPLRALQERFGARAVSGASRDP